MGYTRRQEKGGDRRCVFILFYCLSKTEKGNYNSVLFEFVSFHWVHSVDFFSHNFSPIFSPIIIPTIIHNYAIVPPKRKKSIWLILYALRFGE